MAEEEHDTVPGMAEAVEARRRHLGLTPGDFVKAAGLTQPGLAPVRKGWRKQYSEKTTLGVAAALGWPVDWYDRLLAGEDPATFPMRQTIGMPLIDGGVANEDPERLVQRLVELDADTYRKVIANVERIRPAGRPRPEPNE